MENSTEKKRLITKKDLNKMCLRSWTIMCSWNYERQMHMGFMYGMAPILNKVYKMMKRKKEKLILVIWHFLTVRLK